MVSFHHLNDHFQPIVSLKQSKVAQFMCYSNFISVTGALGALEINNGPGVCCKESLELLFQLID